MDLGRRDAADAHRDRLRGADGVTTVRFAHSGLWDEEAVRSHEGGWGKVFDRLGLMLAEDAATS